MSYYTNPNRHVYTPSSHTRVSARPNLSWSTIREETSSDLLSTEQDEKKDRLSRLKKLERLKERRYMDYQSLKRRGNSKEYSDRFQRDCEEFNQLKYRQVYHTPNTMLFATSKSRSVSVSDMSSKRHRYRYGHTYLRGNTEDGQTLSPTGSVSSIVTLDDDYMYGSRYRTSSFSSSLGRDRLGQYGLSTHEGLDDNLFDDASSEYSFSGYVPQRRAFSSCVTPRRYSGLMTPTADSADAAATVERMGQLQERLKLLQTERSQLERRRSIDLSSSAQMRSRLSSIDTETTSASTHGRYSQESQTILPQSPTDPSIPAWTQRVNLLLSQYQDTPEISTDTDYSSSHSEMHHVEPGYSRHSSDILDSAHSSPYLKSDSSSRYLNYQRQSTIPYGSSPTSISHHYQDGQQLQTSYINSQEINVTNTNQNVNQQRPESLFSRTEYSSHLLKDGQHGADQNSNSQRTTEESRYSADMSPSPLSPGSYNKNFATIHSKTLIVRGQQVSQQPSQDDISDSGVESSSDVGRVSGSVSNDSISKFVVSASKPSESRGRTKFEIALGSPGQRPGSYEMSPEDAAYHSVQESPQEGTTKEVQDSDYTPRRSLRKYDNTPQSIEYDHPNDRPNVENQSEDISQQQSTKTIILSQTGSAQKKIVSPVIQYAEKKLTLTEDMVAKRSKELAEQIFGQKRQSLIMSGEKQPEDNVHNSVETVTFNINRTSDVDPMSHVSKPDIQKDNSSIGQTIDSKTKGIENDTSTTTTTTIIKTVDNYSTETKEQNLGTNVQYNQVNVETLQSTDPMKVTMSEVDVTTDKVSGTMPSVGKSERIENHSERPADKSTKNVSKTLNQEETSQIVFKTVSEELESADVLTQKSVVKPAVNVTEQKNGSSVVIESTVSEEVSDQSIVPPKRKRSKRKKSKGVEKNGLDSKSKTEEELISSSERFVHLEFDSSSVDNENLNQSEMVSNEQPINGNKNDNHVGTIQPKSSQMVQSPNQTKSFKSSTDIIMSKDVKTNVTIVETKQMMDATRETLDKLQSGEQPCLADGVKEIAPSATSSKLATIGYQMTTSVDNVTIQDPGRKSLEKLPDVSVEMPGKSVEQNLPQETAEGSFPEKEGTTVPSKGKSKKKKKNSFRTSKRDEQSGKYLGKNEDPTLAESQEQGDMFNKVTTTTTTVAYKTPERPEEYNQQNISVEFPGQVKVPQQMEYTQGNMSDKVDTIINTVAYKTSEEPENYNTQSMSVNFPGQQFKLGKDGEMFIKETITTKTTSYEADSGPEVRNVQPVNGKFPGKAEDPNLVGSVEQGDVFTKVTTTTKTVGYKTSERPEEYNVQTISAEYPGQVNVPQQMDFIQDNVVDKVKTISNTDTYKMKPEMSERPEDYHVQSVSAEFPGQVKFPEQPTELGKDGDIIKKVTTTTKTTLYEVDSDLGSNGELTSKNIQRTEFNVPENNSAKVTKPTELPLNSEDPNGTETENSSFFGRVASTLKSTFSLSPSSPKSPSSINTSEFNIPSISDDSSSVDPVFSSSTTTIESTTSKAPEVEEDHNVQSISSVQVKVPQQTEFTQGNMTDKVATTINTVAYKTFEKPEEYKTESMSISFPGQQIEPGKDGEMFTKETTTTKTTSYEVDSKMLSGPEIYNTQSVNGKLPGKAEDPNLVGSVEQGDLFTKVTTTTKTVGYKTSERPEEYNVPTISAEYPGQVNVPQQVDFIQDNVVDKVKTISITDTYKMAPEMSERPEEYHVQSASAEFPGQITSPMQTDFTQRNIADKIVTTTISTDQMVPQMSDMTAELEVQSMSVQSPNLVSTPQEPLIEDQNISTKVVTTTETISEKIAPEISTSELSKETEVTEQSDVSRKVMTMPKDVTYKTDNSISMRIEALKAQTMSADFPGMQVELEKNGTVTEDVPADSPKEKSKSPGRSPSKSKKRGSKKIPDEFDASSVEPVSAETSPQPKDKQKKEKSGFLGKVATSIKSSFSKKRSSKSEDFPELVKDSSNVQLNAANVPDDGSKVSYKSVVENETLSSTMKTMPDDLDGKLEVATKTTNLTEEQPDFAEKVITISTTETSVSKISETPEQYNIRSVSAEFPGQGPQQTGFAQDNLVDKVVTISKTAGYAKAPEMYEKPEEYHVQSISADFPGQIKSSMQTDFTQDNIVDKVMTTTVSTDYKMVPEMSDITAERKVQSMSAEFPGLVEGPKYDQSSNQIGTPDMQTSYKTVVERGIKPQEQTLSPTIQKTDFSINLKNSEPNVSYTLSGDQPEINTMSLETSHFTLEKPVTSVKTITKTVTNSSVEYPTDLSVRNDTTQVQEPASTLSQYDPRCAVDSISKELSGKSSVTDVTYNPDFSTLTEPKPLIRQKSWSDVVKNKESVDISDERSQPNISSSISIDKVEISGDRSPNLQQTEYEGRIISGESQAFVIGAPKGTYTPEYANIQSDDVVAPLKAKPTPANKPLLRKLSGQDFSVSDTQKTTKPVLKLVAPDCTLLQTKFETDGWKPKVKSPTATMTTTTTIVQSELISQSPTYDAKTQFAELEHPSIPAPVAPARRSREFRSVSEDSTDGETASQNTTLHLKTNVDAPTTPQSSQPQVPKRKNKKNRKSDRSSSGSVSSDTFNVSQNTNGSQPVQHPEFRMSDQDVFRDTHRAPRSPLESETREKFLTENIISLNKSPHTSITSDSVDVGNLQGVVLRSPKVTSQPEKEHFDFVLDNSPAEKKSPLERSYSAGKSRIMPGQKTLPRDRNNDSDNEEKQEQPSSSMSPDSNARRWKSTEVLKQGRVKPDVPPKNTGLNRVKSTSVKLLSKLQPKPKKGKSPRSSKDEEGFDPEPYDKGPGATKEYPTLEKYPVRRKSRRRGNRNSEPSSPKTLDSEKSKVAAVAPVAPLTFPLPLEESDEPVKERVFLSSWDPTPLLKDLYEIRLMDDDTEDLSHGFIEMEGLMEKLPMNKKKATLLKTWKRRYFRARNGWLLYYDNRNDDKPSDEVLLMGGQVHAMGNQVIGIDDGRGRYLMVRCPSQKEYEQWLTALQSQTTDNTRATYVRPSINAPNHSSKKVVMIEFGSMSIRAGILKEQATLPQLFFPNVVAISNENGLKKHVIGFDAYKPDVRHSSKLVQPFGPTDKVDKFKVDFETVPSLFTAIFKDLKIACKDYHVMLILPVNIIDEEKSLLMNILIDQFKVRGVCMAPQALLALYSYNSQSGIIVDIGERLEVLPIFEGFAIDAGHTLQTFGAAKIRQSLRSGLSSENYPLYSPLEQLLVRLVMEQTCFVSKNFKEDCQQYQENPGKFKETVYLKKFNLPEETYDAISLSLSRFVSPEGLFCKDLWGMDYPTIQSLVKDAIEACPMDNRRHLCRSIYLSGGVTLIPGFVHRLEEELSKQLNETLVVQVHSSPQRYHAAYIGACALCSMPQFEQSCITSEEWKQNGSKAFQKWKMSS